MGGGTQVCAGRIGPGLGGSQGPISGLVAHFFFELSVAQIAQRIRTVTVSSRGSTNWALGPLAPVGHAACTARWEQRLDQPGDLRDYPTLHINAGLKQGCSAQETARLLHSL